MFAFVFFSSFVVSFATIALMFNTELLRQIPKFREKKLTLIFMCVRTLDIEIQIMPKRQLNFLFIMETRQSQTHFTRFQISFCLCIISSVIRHFNRPNAKFIKTTPKASNDICLSVGCCLFILFISTVDKRPYSNLTQMTLNRYYQINQIIAGITSSKCRHSDAIGVGVGVLPLFPNGAATK